MRTELSSRFRMLDANFNRAAEAARVIEDVVRFCLDDPILSASAKSLRHSIGCLRASLSSLHIDLHRDTPGDAGTEISTETEKYRIDLRHILSANFRRLAEGLRVIEETLKLPGLSGSAIAEKARYDSYALETTVFTTLNRFILQKIRLMILYSPSLHPHEPHEIVEALSGFGCIALQLREKNLTDGMLLSEARGLAGLCRDAGIPLIINDRPDICLLSGADGVHLGDEDIPPCEARAIVGPCAVIGVSTHSESSLKRIPETADYIGAGPCFNSSTKGFKTFAGVGYAARATRDCTLPVFAIGGINTQNISALVQAGVGRIAVSNAVCNAKQPRSVIEKLLEQMRISANDT